MMDNILEIRDLKVYYKTLSGYVQAVDGVTLSIKKGESLGLVGESGCGKSSLGLSILRILPSNAQILQGNIFFEGKDLLSLSEQNMNKIRWKGISMIFQGAMNALNPVYKIEDQIVDAILEHEKIGHSQAKKRVAELYKLVGLDYQRAKEYPHEYSGGMKQRAVIALSLACSPKFIIADEPTTALDLIVQDQIIREMKEIQEKLGMSLIYISHDVSIVASSCSMIAVMYAGKIVESTDSKRLFKGPLHPYTRGLLSSHPRIKGPKRVKLLPIPGEPPDLINPPSGCRFHPRCSERLGKICETSQPEIKEAEKGHFVAWHKLEVGRGKKRP